MMFDAFLDPNNFWYIIPELKASGILNSLTFSEKARKTGCMYGEKFNVYIDASDGHVAEYNTLDPCDRILWVVKDTKDKPFLFFKNWYSPSLSSEIEKVAFENNGRLIPFMFWGTFPYFKSHWSNRNILTEKNKNANKIIDIGICAKAVKYYDPKPSKFDKRMSWKGYEWFGHGPAIDTGMNEHSIRIDTINKIKSSKYTHEHIFGVSFDDLVSKSMNWKVVYDVPGMSSVSHRMFEFGWINSCVILAKNDIDFPYSWKEYYPELDYNSDTWENDLGEILESYEEWGDKIKYYLETYCTPEVITNYFLNELKKEY